MLHPAYGIYVEAITANENRRQNFSAIYLTLVATGIALLGADFPVHVAYISGPMVIISILWYSKIVYFRALAKAKFAVLSEMEVELELRPFEAEWKRLQDTRNPIIKLGLARLEMSIPVLVGAGSIALTAITLIEDFCL